MAAVYAIHGRGRVPVLVGGTGFYYRALVRGLFPGPGRDDQVRRRLDDLVARHGPARVHRLLAHVDPPSAARIQVNDAMRVVRALEVYFVSGRTLTAHFAETRAPLEGWNVIGLALRPPWPEIADRITRRVDAQFARGIMDEVRALCDRGMPDTARPFTGYVYKRVLECVRGTRDEASAREFIVRENRHYARRQLIWFRKEPNLVWIHRAGERDDSFHEAERIITERLAAISPACPTAETPTHGPDA
jgi:tRNA dimethylallyltransferase